MEENVRALTIALILILAVWNAGALARAEKQFSGFNYHLVKALFSCLLYMIVEPKTPYILFEKQKWTIMGDEKSYLKNFPAFQKDIGNIQ